MHERMLNREEEEGWRHLRVRATGALRLRRSTMRGWKRSKTGRRILTTSSGERRQRRRRRRRRRRTILSRWQKWAWIFG
jgi:hypothetical protein